MEPFIDALTVTSPDFEPLGRIPDGIAALGGNRSPTQVISGVPSGTVELAVIADDPDAPLPRGYVHLTLYGIPAGTRVLNVEDPALRIGPNGAGETAWTGPQPPVGHGVHHYYFRVYALSRPVRGRPTQEEFFEEYGSAIIEQARLVGTYER